jgi:hypothetical protein
MSGKQIQRFQAPVDYIDTGVFVGGGWHNLQDGVLSMPRGDYSQLESLGFTPLYDAAEPAPEASAPAPTVNVAANGFPDALTTPAKSKSRV